MRRNSSFGAWSATTMPEIGTRGNLVVKGTGATGPSAVGTGTTSGLAARNFNLRNALQKAQAATGADEKERALVLALSQRYLENPPADRAPLDRAYADAMRTVARTYPDDLDIQTLYAEAVMDTMPWSYYEPDGSPSGRVPSDTTVAYLCRGMTCSAPVKTLEALLALSV